VFKITLKTDLPDQLRKARETLRTTLPSLLQQVGVYVLQEQKFSFESKSRGGTGADGVKWKPLADSTEVKKARKSKAFKGRQKRLRALGKRLKAAKSDKQRSKIVGQIDGLGSVPKSQIGVDRGMLRNSSTPGYAGPDGQGGNVLEVKGNRVSVEYGRSYAKWFDEKRPLFPTTAPQSWVDGIDSIVRDWVDQQLSGIN